MIYKMFQPHQINIGPTQIHVFDQNSAAIYELQNNIRENTVLSDNIQNLLKNYTDPQRQIKKHPDIHNINPISMEPYYFLVDLRYNNTLQHNTYY